MPHTTTDPTLNVDQLLRLYGQQQQTQQQKEQEQEDALRTKSATDARPAIEAVCTRYGFDVEQVIACPHSDSVHGEWEISLPLGLMSSNLHVRKDGNGVYTAQLLVREHSECSPTWDPEPVRLGEMIVACRDRKARANEIREERAEDERAERLKREARVEELREEIRQWGGADALIITALESLQQQIMDLQQTIAGS